jgi:hypothetical protein
VGTVALSRVLEDDVAMVADADPTAALETGINEALHPPIGVLTPELPLPGRPLALAGRPSGFSAAGLSVCLDLANKPARGSLRAQL